MTKNRWISVGKQLPPIGEEVIVFVQGRGVTALTRGIRYEEATDFYWDNNYPGSGNLHLAEEVTHWQPLPAPPRRHK